MSNEKKIIEMGKLLPHGSKTKIAKLSGFSIQTVHVFFKTGKATPETSLKLLETAKPFAECYQELRKAELKLLNLFMK
jgi:hypothetical protein